MRNPADFRGHVSRGECDAELMAVASMFVAEVIEMAKVEAARRRKSGAYATQQLPQQQLQQQQQQQYQQQQYQQQQQPLDDRNQQPDSPSKRVRWRRRARGFFARALAILCFRPRRTPVPGAPAAPAAPGAAAAAAASAAPAAPAQAPGPSV